MARELKNLPAHLQTQAIRIHAANEGLSEVDLIKKALEITKPNGADQLLNVAKFWGPRLGLSVDRFVVLAGKLLEGE
ncbi:MAG: hypothetical protein KC643_20920 [Nitrospira sp.]|nr:hypothetical protein [Nitrospira sp.]